MIKFNRDINSYPTKVLVDGSISRMSILNEAGEIGTTRTYFQGTAHEYTEYTLRAYDFKGGSWSRRITGKRDTFGRFKPFKYYGSVLEGYRRERRPSHGCMELVV